MSNYIGLYYPSIGFNNDAWVKLAVLYCDKLGRIVPDGYEIHDSDTVQQLTGELGFIKNFAPSNKDIEDVGDPFSSMLSRYTSNKNLASLYRGDLRSKSLDTPATVVVGQLPRFSNASWLSSDREDIEDTDLNSTSIIAAGKISDYLIEALVKVGLARRLNGTMKAPPWGGSPYPLVEMHRDLAYIYMGALAERMASKLQLHPVTDNMHSYINGLWADWLGSALDYYRSPRAQAAAATYVIEIQMATIALQSVLPRDIANIPTRKIIKLRTQHRDEMTAFQTHIHDLVTSLETLQDLSDPVALKAHLEVEYEKKLKPQIDDLKRCLNALGIDTIMGALNVRVAIPAFLASAASILHFAPINPIVVGSGAIAFSVFPQLQRRQGEARRAIRSSPAAYLLYAQEGLKPANLASQVTRRTRKLLFRV